MRERERDKYKVWATIGKFCLIEITHPIFVRDE